MARARNLKPGFFKNEQLVECSPWARLLFAGLWTLADREGRLEDRPKRIKMEIFPCDDCDCDILLTELLNSGFIRRYEISGKKYIQIVNFLIHQKPHKNEQDSVIPAETGISGTDQSTTMAPSHSDQGPSMPGLLPLTSNSKPPTPLPKKEGFFKNGNGKYHIENHLDDAARSSAKKNAPGWDLHYLMRTYDEGVAERGIPDKPCLAFPVWCKNYTKGKSP